MSVDILTGDCREILPTLPAESIAAVVTDPPYEMAFMGKSWDSTGVTYSVDLWREVARVMKPGAHLLAFGGTRTSHRLTCAIEDAGLEIRDSLIWLYGSGFPKSLDVSKAIGSMAGAEKAEQWDGWGTALKPGHEPITVARKPLVGTVAANVLKHGTGALNIDRSRISYQSDADKETALSGDAFRRKDLSDKGWSRPWMKNPEAVARINREAKKRAETGRWPANVALSEDAANELDAMSGKLKSGANPTRRGPPKFRAAYGEFQGQEECTPARGASTGGASRFFYIAKASSAERRLIDGTRSTHPTVKPLALMRWLVRLVTPPGENLLDPFAGSGTTLVAAMAEGFDAIGIELNPEYVTLIHKRLSGIALPLPLEDAV